MTDDIDSMLSNRSLAVAHWGEHANGGGDRLAWELTRVFEDTPFYVGWRDESIEPADIDSKQLIHGALMKRALKWGGLPRKFAHLLGWQIASPLREFDILLTSGNEPLFYVAPDEQTWVAYVHHTNRRQSSRIDMASTQRLTSLRLLMFYLLRVAFDHNTHRPDLYVVNSEIVKRRIMRYWGIPEEKISVVYPPVPTKMYSPADEETGDHYITLSRLGWRKKIDEIVETFNQLDNRLLIAGEGPEKDSLERLAEDNIEFLGFVDEDEKQRLLSGAKAFVFNGMDEDFGIAPAEALAAGTPLLGVNEGMTRFQVIEGKNGFLHTRSGESGASLSETVNRFEREGVEWTEDEIAAFADRFSTESFHEGIKTAVRRAVSKSDVTPSWYNEYE